MNRIVSMILLFVLLLGGPVFAQSSGPVDGNLNLEALLQSCSSDMDVMEYVQCRQDQTVMVQSLADVIKQYQSMIQMKEEIRNLSGSSESNRPSEYNQPTVLGVYGPTSDLTARLSFRGATINVQAPAILGNGWIVESIRHTGVTFQYKNDRVIKGIRERPEGDSTDNGRGAPSGVPEGEPNPSPTSSPTG